MEEKGKEEGAGNNAGSLIESRPLTPYRLFFDSHFYRDSKWCFLRILPHPFLSLIALIKNIFVSRANWMKLLDHSGTNVDTHQTQIYVQYHVDF